MRASFATWPGIHPQPFGKRLYTLSSNSVCTFVCTKACNASPSEQCPNSSDALPCTSVRLAAVSAALPQPHGGSHALLGGRGGAAAAASMALTTRPAVGAALAPRPASRRARRWRARSWPEPSRLRSRRWRSRRPLPSWVHHRVEPDNGSTCSPTPSKAMCRRPWQPGHRHVDAAAAAPGHSFVHAVFGPGAGASAGAVSSCGDGGGFRGARGRAPAAARGTGATGVPREPAQDADVLGRRPLGRGQRHLAWGGGHGVPRADQRFHARACGGVAARDKHFLYSLCASLENRRKC